MLQGGLQCRGELCRAGQLEGRALRGSRGGGYGERDQLDHVRARGLLQVPHVRRQVKLKTPVLRPAR